jgi:uncharacterized protein (TIGR01777 family)
VARGDEVIALSRDPDRAQAKLPAGARALKWDPQAEPAPAEAIGNANAIVNLLGETIAGRWNDEKKRRILASRRDGTKNLVRAIEASTSRPPVLVSASAVGFYGDRGDDEIDESAPRGNDFLAEVCSIWEAEASRAEALGVRVVLIRTGIVLAKDGGALAEMVRPFRLGVGGPLGSGKQWMPWIHIEDEVGLVLHAIADARLRGPMNACAPEPQQNRVFAKALGKALHRPAVLKAPGFALKLALGEFGDALLGGQRTKPRRATETGYTCAHPSLESALAQILAA